MIAKSCWMQKNNRKAIKQIWLMFFNAIHCELAKSGKIAKCKE